MNIEETEKALLYTLLNKYMVNCIEIINSYKKELNFFVTRKNAEDKINKQIRQFKLAEKLRNKMVEK